MEKLTTVKKGQSVIDLAMQETGIADNALALALQNDMSLTDDPVSDERFDVSVDALDMDTNTVIYYSERSLYPATGLSTTDVTTAPYGGINFMGIETDFIVS